MHKISIVGVGNWGWHHLRVLSTLDDCVIKWVCDKDLKRLQRVKKFYPHLNTTQDFYESLEGVDGVVISTPSSTHYNLAKIALERGVNVLVEKPIAFNVREAEELNEIATKKGLVLMVGHILLFHPAVRKIKSLLENNEIGNIYYLYSQRLNFGQIRSDENVILSLAPHDISVTNYLIGKSPLWVSAHGFSYVNNEIYDIAFITLGYDGGISAHFHLSWLNPKKVRLFVIVGSDKMVIFDDVEPEEKLKILDRSVIRDPFKPVELPPGVIAVRYGNIFTPEISQTEPLREEALHFLDCVKNSKKPISDGENAIEVMRVIDGALLSIKMDGKKIKLR